MFVLLKENLIYEGQRYTAGECLEVSAELAKKLIKKDYASNLNFTEKRDTEEARIEDEQESSESENVDELIPQEALSQIQEECDDQESLDEKPVKATKTKRSAGK